MGRRFLIQLPVAADDLTTAVRVARVIARSLSFHNLVACDEATVATVDQPVVRHPAFCPGNCPTVGVACSARTMTGSAPAGCRAEATRVWRTGVCATCETPTWPKSSGSSGLGTTKGRSPWDRPCRLRCSERRIRDSNS